jgi:hypothetical protein
VLFFQNNFRPQRHYDPDDEDSSRRPIVRLSDPNDPRMVLFAKSFEPSEEEDEPNGGDETEDAAPPPEETIPEQRPEPKSWYSGV